MHQPVTERITTAPPARAHTPGASPSNRKTQTGFSSGSIAPISEQASGGQFRSAMRVKDIGDADLEDAEREHAQHRGSRESSAGRRRRTEVRSPL